MIVFSSRYTCNWNKWKLQIFWGQCYTPYEPASVMPVSTSKVTFCSLWETAPQSHRESFTCLTLVYILNTGCFSFIPVLLGLLPSLAALWICEVIPHCYNATSHHPCLNYDITCALLFHGKNSLPQSHSMLSSNLTWRLRLAGWKFASIWATEACWLLAALLTCGSLFSCVSASAVCLVFGYICTAFCSMSWRKITQPGSSEESTYRRKSFLLCHCSSFSWASSFRFASLYCTWNSSAQTLCFALGMHLP